jgi:hypothetical protein
MMWKVIVFPERCFGIFLENKQGNQTECEDFSVKSNPRPPKYKERCLTVSRDTHLSSFVKISSRACNDKNTVFLVLSF